MFVCQSLGNGGAERVVSVLANGLVENNYKIYVLAMSGKDISYEINNNVNVLFANRKREGIAGKIERIYIIRKAAIINQIDIIIAFSHYNAMFSVLASIGLKVKIIGSERNDPAQLANRKITNFLRIFLYYGLDVLVCQTNDAKNYFPKRIQEKTVVILNPISCNLPEPYKGEREKRIVSFSRLESQKNITMLIDAFEMFVKEYPEYKLEIYGNGREREMLVKYIDNKNLNNGKVCIKPFTSDIHKKVLKAKIFSLASNYEGLSNSMLEAMALGIPVVVTDCPCGGARMVISNMDNGILVSMKKPEEMYRSWKYLIMNKEIYESISTESVKIREILDANKILRQWEEILVELNW